MDEFVFKRILLSITLIFLEQTQRTFPLVYKNYIT